MSDIKRALEKGRGLICYLTAGYPSQELFVEHAMACVDGGADVLEIGVPFSDPVADGRVIQFTSQKAIENGITPMKVFELVKALRSRTDAPMVLMGYYNPIFQIGEERYVRLTDAAGANGLIVPDLPWEESLGLKGACASSGLDLIQLVGPTTSDHRMEGIARASTGFLYVVSALGTTGTRSSISDDVSTLIGRAKKTAGDLPVGVGFGISRPQHTEMLYRSGADAAIVGSAILQRIIDGAGPQDTRRFVESLNGR